MHYTKQDLEQIVKNRTDILLSPHFRLSEMVRSQAAKKRGIDNWPDNWLIIYNLHYLCYWILEPVRKHFGRSVIVSSGYRTPKLNMAVAETKNVSQHCKGEAADFEISGVSNYSLAKWIATNLVFDQLILEFHEEEVDNSGWVHCSVVHNQYNRKDVKSAVGKTIDAKTGKEKTIYKQLLHTI